MELVDLEGFGNWYSDQWQLIVIDSCTFRKCLMEHQISENKREVQKLVFCFKSLEPSATFREGGIFEEN